MSFCSLSAATLWKAPTTRAVSPSACCAVTAALSAGGNCTRATRGGTSGTVEFDDDLAGDVRLDLGEHGGVVGPGDGHDDDVGGLGGVGVAWRR